MAHNAGYSPIAKTGEVLKISYLPLALCQVLLSEAKAQSVVPPKGNLYFCANTDVLFSVTLCLCASFGRGEYSNGCGVLPCTVAPRTYHCLCVYVS